MLLLRVTPIGLVDSENTKCRNCGASLTSNYCPDCGQKSSIDKISFRETIQDFLDSVFSVNAPLIITIKLLIINPGKLFRNYIKGQRKSYYKPIAFFLIITVIYLIIRELIGFDPFHEGAVTIKGDDGGSTLFEARKYMLEHINNLLFIFAFTMALLLKLFFWKRNSLAEFLAISFYLCGVYTFFVTINIVFAEVFKTESFYGLLVMYLYFLYAIYSYSVKHRVVSVIKAAVLYPIALLSYMASAFAISILIVYFL